MRSLVSEVMGMEKRQERNIDWFYYNLKNPEHFESVCQNGIWANACLTSKEIFDYHGLAYYIRLYKAVSHFDKKNHYDTLASISPLLMLKDVKVLPCHNKAYLRQLRNSILPFRYSCYEDEYQAFLSIDSKKIIGIECALYDMVKENEGLFLKNLSYLSEMITFMERESMDLPIYDHSRMCGMFTHEVDKESVLYLNRKLN